jgi:type II secretory pathway predicted ATPase ExeA
MEPLQPRAACPEALLATPAVEDFGWRIEHTLAREGGFALITGAPGTGKSVALRLLAARLQPLPDLTVAALTHPSANLADFYRELGDLFAVELRPHNRWMGFKALRARWLACPLDPTLLRPVLLVDEAQELAPAAPRRARNCRACGSCRRCGWSPARTCWAGSRAT